MRTLTLTQTHRSIAMTLRRSDRDARAGGPIATKGPPIVTMGTFLFGYRKGPQTGQPSAVGDLAGHALRSKTHRIVRSALLAAASSSPSTSAKPEESESVVSQPTKQSFSTEYALCCHSFPNRLFRAAIALLSFVRSGDLLDWSLNQCIPRFIGTLPLGPG